MHPIDRRRFLGAAGLGSFLWAVPGVLAGQLMLTPKQTEGPFYPDKLPLDTDNDLIVVNNAITPAVGEISWVTGRILDARGEPVRDALVEIWQCDNNGAYLHSKTSNKDKQDRNFQGFGRFLTGSTGEYVFRTIKPVSYPGRTPHIHYIVKRKGREKFTTQCYIKDHPENGKDVVLKAMKDEKAKSLLMVQFHPVKGSRVGELSAKFDIVLGYTPET
ncbi:MAG TPA: protocatechuate 3,4-dioxygenase [Bryobacteraceae bacterium]|nr:protocatechuate 3,4-dioxygenase [Bryobacteraceae bacterium]